MYLHINLCTSLRSDTFRSLCDQYPHTCAAVWAECSENSGQLCTVRNNVDGSSGLQRANGNGAAFSTERVPEVRKPNCKPRCRLQRIHALFWFSTMGAFPANGNGKGIGCGIEFTVPNPDRAQRQIWRDMCAKYGIYLAQVSGIYKPLCAAAAFLIWFK